MKRILIILNSLAALWIIFWSPAIPKAADAQRHRQVLELCDAGVIDTNALHAYLPDAQFPEGTLSRSFSHSWGYFRFFLWPAGALSLLNAVMIAVFWKTNQKELETSNQPSERTR